LLTIEIKSLLFILNALENPLLNPVAALLHPVKKEYSPKLSPF